MADYVKKRTHIINHVRFIRAGALARDLYDWGMLWSGQQETDGEIPMDSVLCSPWGYGNKRNVTLAQKLVEVGLWERTDTGYRICKWSEQGNRTKAELNERRRGDRERKSKTSTPPSPTLDGLSGNLPHGIPSSTSYSPSGSGSLGEMQEGVPAWWAGAIATAEQVVGGKVDQPGALWLEYDAARDRKGWARNHRDAVGWLSAVIRSGRERERQNARPKSAAEITKQPYDPEAPWMKLGDTGS